MIFLRNPPGFQIAIFCWRVSKFVKLFLAPKEREREREREKKKKRKKKTTQNELGLPFLVPFLVNPNPKCNIIDLQLGLMIIGLS